MTTSENTVSISSTNALSNLNLSEQALSKILRNYCLAVKQANPNDIIAFSANYFENIHQQQAGENRLPTSDGINSIGRSLARLNID
mmetsp:Transcript_6384/g.24002  ORF Transcript_6384/g.24002 Transcript_6384/m.24002 type:complete len:86 (-) Transcript_6384:120-377(-)